eukprot:6197017-Pleurochrysis_carterae.AAC.1
MVRPSAGASFDGAALLCSPWARVARPDEHLARDGQERPRADARRAGQSARTARWRRDRPSQLQRERRGVQGGPGDLRAAACLCGKSTDGDVCKGARASGGVQNA